MTHVKISEFSQFYDEDDAVTEECKKIGEMIIKLDENDDNNNTEDASLLIEKISLALEGLVHKIKKQHVRRNSF